MFRNPSRSAAFLTFGVLVLVAASVGAQRFAAKGADAGTTARQVADMVTRKHISHARIDDRVSERLVKRYIESLDPQKLYFTKADVKQFNANKTILDDNIKSGNVDFAFQAFDVYLTRLDERIKLAQTLIDEKHDFTIDEEIVIDADDLDWAGTEDEIRERWRKRIKFDMLSLRLDKTQNKDEIIDRLHKRYATIQNTMKQTEDFEKLEMYLSSLTHCLDPHSSYMSKQTLDDFRISMELKLEGIGAALRSEDGYTIVAEVVAGGAAEEDGRLEVDDRITAVDSRANGEWTDVVEMKLSRVVRFIRGPKGTRVRLQVKKGESGETVVYELKRKTIELKESAVKGRIIDTKDRTGGRVGRIGVIHVPSFYRDFRGAQLGLANFKSARRDIQKVLGQFEQQGPLDAVIVDLRFNGGGALVEAVEVSGLFIPQGAVVQTKEQNNQIRQHTDPDPDVWYNGPLVVVCNRLSASASEIFAGAIKDWDRGIIVGDTTTHGKGTVQNVMPVGNRFFPGSEDRGALKLTIQQFYRVNGESTQVNGVTSDVVLPSILDHRDIGESSLDNALPFDRINPAVRVAETGRRKSDVISMLGQRSKARIAQVKEFQEVSEDVEKFIERKNRKTLTLNEAKLRQEREEAKRDSDEDEKDEKKDKKEEGPIFPSAKEDPTGFYNDELLNITLDYVELLKGVATAKN